MSAGTINGKFIDVAGLSINGVPVAPGAGAPGGGQYAIQVNDPVGTFAGASLNIQGATIFSPSTLNSIDLDGAGDIYGSSVGNISFAPGGGAFIVNAYTSVNLNAGSDGQPSSVIDLSAPVANINLTSGVDININATAGSIILNSPIVQTVNGSTLSFNVGANPSKPTITDRTGSTGASGQVLTAGGGASVLWGSPAEMPYGSWYSNTTQALSAPGTTYLNLDGSYITNFAPTPILPVSAIPIPENGVYKISWGIQPHNTDVSQHNITVFIVYNTIPVPETGRFTTIAPNDRHPITGEYIKYMETNDIISVAISTAGASLEIQALPASPPGREVAIPSFVFMLNKIGYV